MKRKIILSLAGLVIAIPAFSKTLVVSETIDGKENILAQKDISNDAEGVLTYNMCSNIKGLNEDDLSDCQSSVKYLNSQTSTTVELQHYEFVEFQFVRGRGKLALLSQEQAGGQLLKKGDEVTDRTPKKLLRVYIK